MSKPESKEKIMKAAERYNSDMEADKINQAVGVDNSLLGLFMACSFCIFLQWDEAEIFALPCKWLNISIYVRKGTLNASL